MTLPASYTTAALIAETVPAIGSVSNLTSSYISSEIGKIQAAIDVKLSRLYSVPFSTVPPLIQAIATDLTAKAILEKRIFTSNRVADEKLTAGFQGAEDLLSAVSSGAISLVDSAGNVIAQRTDQVLIWSNTSAYQPTFHNGAWGDMKVDEDRLEDDSEARA